MGCCCSQSPILDDPTITANFKVARFYAVRGYTSLKNDAPGLLYIDRQNLYYEATCGEKRACCLCCRFCQPLSTIKEVTIKEESQIVETLQGYRSNNFMMIAPYLQVTIDNGVILAASASRDNMESFSQRLKSNITTSSIPCN